METISLTNEADNPQTHDVQTAIIRAIEIAHPDDDYSRHVIWLEHVGNWCGNCFRLAPSGDLTQILHILTVRGLVTRRLNDIAVYSVMAPPEWTYDDERFIFDPL